MPDDARVWIFGADRPLDPPQREALLRGADAFLEGWHAHRQPVIGARDLPHDQFLVIAADERASGVSGCSIDSLFRTLKELEGELGVTLLDGSRVWFVGREGEIRTATRAEFRALAEAGEVDGSTRVFDNTVATVGALRGGHWERPMAESWHGRAFAAALNR